MMIVKRIHFPVLPVKLTGNVLNGVAVLMEKEPEPVRIGIYVEQMMTNQVIISEYVFLASFSFSWVK